MPAGITCQRKAEKLLKNCFQAAAKADAIQAPDFLGQSRLDVFFKAADVFLRDRQYEMARTYANKALTLLERGHGDLAKPCAAYTMRAEAEWGLKEPATADRDFTTAEQYEQIAIAVIQDDTLRKDYVRVLKNVFGIHAQFLEAAGQTAAAQAKVAEAAKL